MGQNRQKNPDAYIKDLERIISGNTSDLLLRDVLDLIVLILARATGFEICTLWLMDDSKNPGVLYLAATQALDTKYFKDRTLAMGQGVVGTVAATKNLAIIPDLSAETLFVEKQMADDLSLKSMLSIPMIDTAGRANGVLSCFTRVRHDFTKKEISMVTGVSLQAAVIIEGAGQMVRSRVTD